MNMRRITAFLLLLLGTITSYAQNSLTVEAPNVVSLDETFRVVFTADGSLSDFNWNCPSDFTIAWGPQRGTMSSTNIVNGKRTSLHQETYTYLLQAKSEGTFSLPSATGKIDKKEYSSRSLTIEVVKGGNATNSQNSQTSSSSGDTQTSSTASSSVSSEDIFMRLTLNKSNVVKGEPIVATLKLYTLADIQGFENVKFPTFNGFWSKEIDTPQNIEFVRENVNGKIYNSALMRKYTLIPQQTGSISIEPAEIIALLRVRTTSSGAPRSIFDDFFDNYQTIRKRVATPTMKVNVRALPAGAPQSFAGGVGDFTMKSSFTKDTLNAHEAASLMVTISGKGNISMLEAPKVNFPPDFEVYDIKTTEKVSADGLSGSKTFEYPFIPRSYGEFHIEPVNYSYYDISKGSYKTLSTGDLRLGVGKGNESDATGAIMPGVNRQIVKNLAEDIRFIAIGDAGLKKEGAFFAGSLFFYLLIVLIVVLFFIFYALINAMIRRRMDVVGSRNRKANKMARARLHQAGDYLKRNLNTAYYEELHKAVLGYVSDKLTIPSADLSKDKICEVLLERGASQDLIDQLLSILDACEFARYAPESETAAMESHYNQAVKVISELEGKVKTNSNNKKATKLAMVLMLLGMSIFVANGQNSVDSLWSKANASYTDAHYQNALNYYQMIEGEKLVSADLYYNIGNTYYKMNDVARAILYYEKALKFDQSHQDAANNLAICNTLTLDKIEVVPEFILITWIRDVKYLFSANVWAWSTVALILIVAILMLLFFFARSSSAKKVSFIFSCIILFFSICTFAFSISEKADAMREDKAIVTIPVSSVKSSPGDAGKAIFVLHEGTKVSILDELGEWTKIELADGRQGWLTNNSFEII